MKLPKKILLRLVWFGLAFGLAVNALALLIVVAGWSQFERTLPPLDPWHVDFPASEFTACDETEGFTFADYLAQEDKVSKNSKP